MKKIIFIGISLFYSCILVCQERISKTEIFDILENKTNGIYFISFGRPDCKPSESMKTTIEYLVNKHMGKVKFYNYTLQNEIFVFPKEHIIWNEDDTPKDIKFHQTPSYAIIRNGKMTTFRTGTFGEKWLNYLDITLADYHNEIRRKIEQKYDNGNLMNIYYLNNLDHKVGEQKMFYENGKLWYKIIWSDYADAESMEEEVSYHENGNIAAKKKYQSITGYPEGYWSSYYENGKIKAEGNFDDLLEVTEPPYFRSYYETGELMMTVRVLREFSDDFKLLKKDIVSNQDITFVIEKISFYKEGAIAEKQKWVSKLFKPEEHFFAESKILATSGLFSPGNLVDFKHEKAGTYLSYHENGKVSSQVEYKYGKLNGFLNYYYDNGNLISKIKVEDDLFKTLISHNDYSGYKSNGGTLKDGFGTLNIRDWSNGNVVSVVHFEQGKPVKEEKK